MKIIALDLGTQTGVAGSVLSPHTVELATRKELGEAKKLRLNRRLDPRAARLTKFLLSWTADKDVDWIVFEDVKFAKSSAQAHLWGTFRGVVWAVATLRGIQVECLDTVKLKKFASGSGVADKDQMAAALIRLYPARFKMDKGLVCDLETGTLLDDNAVDSLHLLFWAMQTLDK